MMFEDCEAANYDSITDSGTAWPGTQLTHSASSGNIKGASVTLNANRPCTYTNWLMLHGSHNYSREVESMPLY